MIFIKLSVNTLDSSGRGSLADLNEVMLHGGLIRVNGINVLFDYDINLNYYGSLTGYYIINALNYKVYFKCRDRKKAQETCDMIYGKNLYTVNSKIWVNYEKDELGDKYRWLILSQ